MRTERPVLICDAGETCGCWVLDFYEECADSVDGVRITSTVRHPGWTSTDDADFCPDHAPILSAAEMREGKSDGES